MAVGRREAAGGRAIVILGGEHGSTNIVYNALKPSFDIRGVIIETRVARRQFLSRRVHRLGLFRVLGQILFRGLVVPSLRASSRQRIRDICDQHGLDDRPIEETVVTRVPSVNSDEAIAALRGMDPSVVVVNGTRIISKPVLDSVPARFVNMHAGITPLYRGVHGAYWALVQGDRPACGVTVHLVDPGIDTGTIIDQAVIDPTPQDNFVTYPLHQLAAGLPLLEQAVRDALNGRVATKDPPAGPSRLWSHPTLWGYLWHRARHGVK
jgi:folate-dependent phosphoribosylglycinamide formyltransferase PurN